MFSRSYSHALGALTVVLPFFLMVHTLWPVHGRGHDHTRVRAAYTGPVVDLHDEPDPLDHAHARARITTGDNGTSAKLRITGIEPTGQNYAVHGHTGPCRTLQPATAEGHYQDQIGGPVTDDNELWLDFTERNGKARATDHDTWTVRPTGIQSIVIHDAASGTRLACIPLAL